MTNLTADVTRPDAARWWQLAAGVVCMMLIANLQYGWTLYVGPMQTARGWPLAEIQIAFSIFIALETWLTPVAGWIVDILGPRPGPFWTIAAGGVLTAAGGAIQAAAGSIALLYLGAAVAGIGAGGIYATCVGNAVKWFPDRRGLAVGCTAAGFGAGAALTIVPVRMVIAASGYQTALWTFGLGQGVILLAMAFVLRGPDRGEAPAPAQTRVRQSALSATPRQMLATPGFWLLYVMFTLISASGLMATAQLAPIARSFGVADAVLLFGASTLTVALIVDNVMNGLARPFFGWVSDRIGREPTMAIAFGLGGLSYWLLGAAGTQPWLFVVCAGLIFFTWGEIFSLFPSTCTDMFGTRFVTTNAALLYTAKGTSAWLVPVANLLTTGGDWHFVFAITALANWLVALVALIVLPMARAVQLAKADRQARAADLRAP